MRLFGPAWRRKLSHCQQEESMEVLPLKKEETSCSSMGVEEDWLSEDMATSAAPPPTPPPHKKHLALGELFKDEDQALLKTVPADVSGGLSITEKVQNEVQLYRSFPAVLSSVNPILWWWQKKDQKPMLSKLANKYLCVQASSTLSERVFSTAGDTLSVERAQLLPERVDMLVFLKKNYTKTT
ncbi:hypothetical protein UPYG_G00203940 [Umbra pygmaea]|uniref:HAT C-terminal dimerisation domain-containing protein n=1 Tax=Umbra pygmaea TaxID=75934 RepID=A0ABD0X0X7_UMBPY